MIIKIVRSLEDIRYLEPGSIVHVTFRPSRDDILAIHKACPDILAIQLPSSHFKSLSVSAIYYLKTVGIKLIKGNTIGVKGNKNPEYTVSDIIINEIRKQIVSGKTNDSIIKSFSKHKYPSKELLQFIINELKENLRTTNIIK